MSMQPPVPQMNQQDERLWGMLCHLTALSGFIGVPLGWILGPFLVWLIKKDASQFVDAQGKSSMNFQISILIYEIILCLIGLTGFLAIVADANTAVVLMILAGLALIVLGVFEIVQVIIASIAAKDGRSHRYPISIQFIR